MRFNPMKLPIYILALLAMLVSGCSVMPWGDDEHVRLEQPPESVSHSDTAASPKGGRTMETIKLESIQEKEAQLLLEVSVIEDMSVEEKHRRLLEVVYAYENFIARFPESELGYIFYGKLLRKIGMNKKANNMFARANRINPNLPVVKQQIGNFLAEEGMFELALPYFISAIELDPNTALYHYQLGELLFTYYEAYLSKEIFDRSTLDEKMLTAFRRAAELEPKERTFAYRYAEALYDVEHPDWHLALKTWDDLLKSADDERERDIIRMHQARLYILWGHPEVAKRILDSIDQPALEASRKELLAQIK